jgi:hypothetical protein
MTNTSTNISPNTVELPGGGYSGHGWKGVEYDTIKSGDIAPQIRQRLKGMFPKCKFSVTRESYSGGFSIHIALLSAPFPAFSPVDRELYPKHYHGQTVEEFCSRWADIITCGHLSVNEYHLDEEYFLTPQAKEVLAFVIGLCQRFNMDDSDAMTDYFRTRFYLHLSVGKWDRPFQQLT